jgi:hypothetical protein
MGKATQVQRTKYRPDEARQTPAKARLKEQKEMRAAGRSRTASEVKPQKIGTLSERCAPFFLVKFYTSNKRYWYKNYQVQKLKLKTQAKKLTTSHEGVINYRIVAE